VGGQLEKIGEIILSKCGVSVAFFREPESAILVHFVWGREGAALSVRVPQGGFEVQFWPFSDSNATRT
jgi:hypothetical protein